MAEGAGTPIVALLVLLLAAAAALIILEYSELTAKDAALSASQSRETACLAQESSMDQLLVQKDADISGLQSSLSSTQLALNQTNSTLQAALSALDLSLGKLESQGQTLEQTREEMSSLSQNLTDMEQSINESIKWFTDNSVLTPGTSFFAPYAADRCVSGNELNLACVEYFMEKRLGFEYINKSADKLYSIDEMIAHGGGDCKEYSIFLKALLNTYKDEGKDYELTGWTPGSGRFQIYSSGQTLWYYNGSATDLGMLEGLKPYSICYVTQVSDEEIEGHCIVALAEDNVSVESGGLTGLDGAMAFEPQDGQYMGDVGTAFHVCQSGEEDCDTSVGSIVIVMSDNDIYEFRDGQWDSLGGFMDMASVLGKRLENATS